MNRLTMAIVLAFCALAKMGTAAEDLAQSFAHPPYSARPLTWWHWLDGNITRET